MSQTIIKQISDDVGFYKNKESDGVSPCLTYVFAEEVCVWSELRVDVSDELHNILYHPRVGVLSTGPWAFS